MDRASDCLKAMRLGDGQWTKIETKDPGGTPVRLYLGPDKSPKQEKCEMLCKKLGKICKAELGDESVYDLRQEGIVKYEWQELACINLPNPTTVELLWNPEVAKSIGEKKEVIIKAFEEGGKGTVDIQWSRS